MEIVVKKMKIVKKNDGVNYIDDFLKLITVKNIRMTEASKCTQPSFFIRHDVDHSLAMAVKIAEIEAAHGFLSTFFLLPPGSYGEENNYYGYIHKGKIIHHQDLIEKCKYIADLGHEIGLHNDMVSRSLVTREHPKQLIDREVDFFKSYGLTMGGTASHGSPLARQLKYNNRELFKGCIRKGWETRRIISHNNWQVKLHSLELSEFDFQYEAYSLQRDSRISDSGGKWGGRVAGHRIDKESMQKSFNLNHFRQIISQVTPDSGVKVMQVMTHPCHWEVV